MRDNNRLVFAMSGLFAGVLLLVLAKVLPLILLFGVGPTMVGACLVAAMEQRIHVGLTRGVAAIVLSVPAYLLSFAAFAETSGFAQRHGLIPSSRISDLGADIVLGLVAAVLVASILLEGLAFLLSGRWRTRAAVAMMVGGVGSILCSFAAREAYGRLAGPPQGTAQLAILFGPLLLIGGAVTTMIIGEQMSGARALEDGGA